MLLDEWAAAWGIPAEALLDLRKRCGVLEAAVEDSQGRSESNVSSRLRLESSKRGYPFWRNNVGALIDDRGVPVRYGLANDSKQVNERLKSGDLIACKPTVILSCHVGRTIGQFVSVEVKHEGWKYTGTKREIAQLNWINLVNSRGGWASFVTSPEQLP